MVTHSSSFDLKCANDFYNQMVIPQFNEFIANNYSCRHALLTTILAYHMYEWVNGAAFSKQKFKEQYPSHCDLAEDFDVARHITNGTKHFKNKPVKTYTQGGFSSGFSDAFARPLNIEYPNTQSISADQFLRKLIGFWEKQKDRGAF